MEEDLLSNGKSVDIHFEYLGEDTQEVLPQENPIVSTILEFVYTTYPNIYQTYMGNEKITVYDIMDELFHENPRNAADIYRTILENFAPYLKDKSDAYWLTEPFLEIFMENNNFSFFSYLIEYDSLAQLLLIHNCFLPDCFIDMLCESIQKNNLELLKKYIGYIIRNNLFESNSECMNFDEILDTFRHSCSSENSELLDYLSKL